MTYREYVSSEEKLANLVVNKILDGVQTSTDATDTIRELVADCNPTYVAKLAVYAYQVAEIRDTSVYLLAEISDHTELFKATAPLVLNNLGQIRKFVSFKRKGLTSKGTKSLGSAPKKYISKFLNSLSAEELYWQSYGSNPSTGDIIRLAHARPSASLQQMFRHLMGYKVDKNLLPQHVEDLQLYRTGDWPMNRLPAVPARLIENTLKKMSPIQIKEYISMASPNQLRRNINALERLGAWKDKGNISIAIKKLEKLSNTKTMLPLSLYTTIISLEDTTPQILGETLSEQLEHILVRASKELANVLTEDTSLVVDCSGSMSFRIDKEKNDISYFTLACLFAYPLTKCANVKFSLFDTKLYSFESVPNRSFVEFLHWARKNDFGGGTDMGVALTGTNSKNTIIISDNETWKGKRVSRVWSEVNKERNKKLVLWDIAPNGMTPVTTDSTVLNLSGTSESIYQTIEFFFANERSLLEQINAIDLRI